MCRLEVDAGVQSGGEAGDNSCVGITTAAGGTVYVTYHINVVLATMLGDDGSSGDGDGAGCLPQNVYYQIAGSLDRDRCRAGEASSLAACRALQAGCIADEGGNACGSWVADATAICVGSTQVMFPDVLTNPGSVSPETVGEESDRVEDLVDDLPGSGRTITSIADVVSVAGEVSTDVASLIGNVRKFACLGGMTDFFRCERGHGGSDA